MEVFSFGIQFPVISDRGSLCGAVMQRGKLAVCVCQERQGLRCFCDLSVGDKDFY